MSHDPNSKNPKPSEPSPQDEEFVQADDAAIGRALKLSAVALVVLGALVAGVILLKPKKAPPAVKKTELSAPTAVQTAVREAPSTPFTDITTSAGIQFVHFNGAYGDKLLPETMGGGAAFLDFDNDGDQDLIFVNGGRWPWRQDPASPPPPLALYKNDGKGNFTDVTAGSGLTGKFYGMGVAIGDYDNDGLPDVFVTGVGGTHLFHNRGNGKFADVTAEAQVGGDASDWTTSAAWVDVNNDGKLDLFVCNYVRWSKEIDLEVGYKLVGLGRAYGPPMNFGGSFPKLYLNQGNGTFRDVSATAGIQIKNTSTGVPSAKSMAVAPVDLDNDGWMDLVVANDTVQNFVFLNQKDGTFKEVGAVSGMAFDNYGNARGAMGIDTAWFRNDAALGIAIANFANEMSALYVSQNRPMTFADEAISEGIGPAGRLLLKFGIFFFDYDLDGRMDVLTCNGHLEEEISKVQQSQQFRQSAQLFWNSGVDRSPCFTAVTPTLAGKDLFEPIVGRGSAFADIDGDGDLDVLLLQAGGKPKLLRNDQKLNHHWIRLKLVGKSANRDAIGAVATLTTGGRPMRQQVMPTRSYLSQSERLLTFGLGSASKADFLTIRWPGGQIQNVPVPAVDTVTVIEQP